MTQEILIIHNQRSSVDFLIAEWLKETCGKSSHESSKTRTAYTTGINDYRQAVVHCGYDLDQQTPDALLRLEIIAQEYAAFSRRGKPVAPATYNQRLAILSSFFEYAKRKRILLMNPIDTIKRDKVQAYANARAISPQKIAQGLHAIDRATLQGARDYALLSVFLQTGRRLSEVATLQRKHLFIEFGEITLDFQHCKGGKVMADTLGAAASRALAKWLERYYRCSIDNVDGEAQVWVILSRDKEDYGKSLGIQAIADICKKAFGTSSVHRLRHTFAHTMEEAGASVSEIQARLGHESLATTGRYLAQLKQAKNRHADVIASRLGIE